MARPSCSVLSRFLFSNNQHCVRVEDLTRFVGFCRKGRQAGVEVARRGAMARLVCANQATP